MGQLERQQEKNLAREKKKKKERKKQEEKKIVRTRRGKDVWNRSPWRERIVKQQL